MTATYLMKNIDLKIWSVISRRTTLFPSAYDWYLLPLFLDFFVMAVSLGRLLVITSRD